MCFVFQAISREDKKKADRSEEERLLHHSESTLPSNQSLPFNQGNRNMKLPARNHKKVTDSELVSRFYQLKQLRTKPGLQSLFDAFLFLFTDHNIDDQEADTPQKGSTNNILLIIS